MQNLTISLHLFYLQKILPTVSLALMGTDQKLSSIFSEKCMKNATDLPPAKPLFEGRNPMLN